MNVRPPYRGPGDAFSRGGDPEQTAWMNAAPGAPYPDARYSVAQHPDAQSPGGEYPGGAPPGAPAPDPAPRRRRLGRRGVLAVVVVGALLGAGIGLAGTMDSNHSASNDSAGTAAAGDPAASPSAGPNASPSGSAGASRGASPSASASASARPSAPAGVSGKAVAPPPGGKGACASPAACGYPGAASTGFGSTKLKAYSGDISIHDSNVVIKGWNLTGSLDIYGDNVTIEYSKITSSNWWGVNLRPGYTGLRILHSTITGVPGKGPDNGGEDYALSNMGEGSVEVGWNDLSVFTNTVSTGHGYIHDNYVHGLVPFLNRSGAYAHADTIISEGGDTAGLRIEHNTLLNPIDTAHGASAVIGLYPDSGAVTDTTIKDNWMAGGAYALYGGGSNAARIVVSGNVFSTEYWSSCGVYGPITYWNAGGAGNVWQGNSFSNGKAIAAPSD